MSALDVSFDLAELDSSIAESGLASEFDLEKVTQRRLAALGSMLCSAAVAASTDARFEAFLADFEPPASPAERAFLFGFAEHVRQDVLLAFSAVEESMDLRTVMGRRLRRAQDLCAA